MSTFGIGEWGNWMSMYPADQGSKVVPEAKIEEKPQQNETLQPNIKGILKKTVETDSLKDVFEIVGEEELHENVEEIFANIFAEGIINLDLDAQMVKRALSDLSFEQKIFALENVNFKIFKTSESCLQSIDEIHTVRNFKQLLVNPSTDFMKDVLNILVKKEARLDKEESQYEKLQKLQKILNTQIDSVLLELHPTSELYERAQKALRGNVSPAHIDSGFYAIDRFDMGYKF